MEESKITLTTNEIEIVNLHQAIESAYDLNEDIVEFLYGLHKGNVTPEECYKFFWDHTKTVSTIQTLLSHAEVTAEKLSAQI